MRTDEADHRERAGQPVVLSVDEPISPELVLIDPELARRVRSVAAPAPGSDAARAEVLSGPARVAVALRPPAPSPEALPPRLPLRTRTRLDDRPTPPRTSRRSRQKRALSTSAATLATAGLLGAAFLPPRDGPVLLGAPTTVDAQAAPLALTWRPNDAADYYLVEVFSAGELVHAKSVGGTLLELPAWLPAGRYSWRVLAGEGPPSARLVRGPIERGWIRVDR